MKRSLFALAALVLLIACNKNEHEGANLHITGNIKGLRQGKLYIQQFKDTSLVVLDTIIIDGSSAFESHLNIESPEMLYLFLDRGQTNSVDNNLPFFAEPGNMRIETSNETFFYNAKITGSENHKLYEDFIKMKNNFTGTNTELKAKSLEATMSGDVKRLDSIAEASDLLLKRRYLYTANFALNNAKKEIGPYLALSEIPDANVKYLDTIAKAMTPGVAKSKYGKMLKDYIVERKQAEAAEIK